MKIIDDLIEPEHRRFADSVQLSFGIFEERELR
jgi:hypothetical protein